MSRSRSAWKIPYIHPSMFSDALRIKKFVYLWKRQGLVSSLCLDKTFRIHAGNKFVMVKIKQAHLNLRFGQLSSTTVSGNVKKKKAKVVVKKKKK